VEFDLSLFYDRYHYGIGIFAVSALSLMSVASLMEIKRDRYMDETVSQWHEDLVSKVKSRRKRIQDKDDA